jgi:glutaredoxin
MIEKSGQAGVPVIEIDGQMVIGFNTEQIKKLLKLEQ